MWSRHGSRTCFVLCCLGVMVALGGGVIWARTEVLFGPEERPGDRVVQLYGDAKREIFVAMFGLTYPPAIQALVAAKRRGIDVRVITDRERLQDQKQVVALETLRLAGIPIRINQHENLMHLKQTVIDGRINAHGSMNQTTSGNQYNDERLDVLTDRITTAKAKRKFLQMWNDHERYAEWTGGPLSGGAHGR